MPAIQNQLNKLSLGQPQPQVQQVKQAQLFCEVYGEGHGSNMCRANPESVYLWVMPKRLKIIRIMAIPTTRTEGIILISHRMVTKATIINIVLKIISETIGRLKELLLQIMLKT